MLCLPWLAATGQKWKPAGRQSDSLTAVCERNVDYFARWPECRRCVSMMYAIADRQRRSPVLRWRAMYWDALRLWQQAKTDSARALAQKAIKMTDSVRYEYDYRRLQRLLLNCAADSMSLFEAYKAYHAQLLYFEKVDDAPNIANTCVTIGIIFQQLGESHKASDYLQRADSLFAKCGKTSYRVKNRLNLANALHSKGRRPEALALLQNVARQPEARADTAFMLQVYGSLASCASSTKQRDRYSVTAYRLAEAYGREDLIMQACINMGYVFIGSGNGEEALYFYRRALRYLQMHPDYYRIQLPALNGMAQSFGLMQKWDSAYIYLSAAQRCNDSLQTEGNLSEIYRQESLAAISNYDAALARQREEARLHQLVAGLLSAVVILSCGFACYGFWSQRRKALVKKQLQESENKELATRLENEELRFRLEMDSKNRELVSNSLMLIEKNQMLDELLQRIDSGGEAGHITKRTVLELKNQIRAHASEDDEWRAFRTHFEKVHPGFFARLREMFPCLTEYELRLCAYFRTGMQGKQIAMMLSIQPESIKKSRTRLRKKLRLEPDVSLVDFLRDVSGKEEEKAT